MKCRICETELDSNARVCPICDTPVQEHVEPVQKKVSKYGRVFKRFDYQNDGNARLTMSFVCIVFFIVGAFRAFSTLDHINSYFQSELYKSVSAIGGVCILL